MLRFSHQLQDPDTGELYDVHYDDGQDDAELVRNGPPGRRNPLFPGRGPRRPGLGGSGRGLTPRSGSVITPTTRPVAGGHRPLANQPDPDHIIIRKDDLVSLISMGGELWASFLGRPDMPQATGDHVADRTNAAMHRDALAQHDQSRDRIRALTGLAQRAAKMLLS